jgi:glyoxylase-like metal-dependent hydrolase (beta-lactamase superfamily II)
MGVEIKVLDLGDIELESSFLVLGHDCGLSIQVPVFGFLILGGEAPVLVDTGFSRPEIMGNLGMKGFYRGDQGLDKQLAKHGLHKSDVRWILHTHLHIDHSGKDSEFSMDDTTVVINRRELEYSVSGIMGEQYPAEYVKHLVDRLHHPGALRLLDLELSGRDEVMPGVWCEAAGGHTEGSMNVNVITTEGVACICGDVIYDIQNQIVDPIYQVLDYEPQSTGNQGTSKRQERAAIKRALNSGAFVLPLHDWPARVKSGRIVSRLVGGSVPGPEQPVEHKTCAETGQMGMGAVEFLPGEPVAAV